MLMMASEAELLVHETWAKNSQGFNVLGEDILEMSLQSGCVLYASWVGRTLALQPRAIFRANIDVNGGGTLIFRFLRLRVKRIEYLRFIATGEIQAKFTELGDAFSSNYSVLKRC